jgi:hypothetical protein
MEDEELERLFTELKKVRARETEILNSIEGIFRKRFLAEVRAKLAKKGTSPQSSVSPTHSVYPPHSARTRVSTVRASAIVDTVNGIALGDRVFIKTRVNKPADWPKKVDFDRDLSRYGTVTQVQEDQIHVRTDTNVNTWRKPHNVRRIQGYDRSMSVSGVSVTSGLTENTSAPGRTVSTGVSSYRSGRSQGRGRFKNRGSPSRSKTAESVSSGRFKGDTEQMNGHVFECYDEQSDRRQFAKTIEALEGYAKKHLTFSDDLAPLSASVPSLPALSRPPGPTSLTDET